MIDIDNLEALAMAATPGPWETDLDRNEQQNVYAAGDWRHWIAVLPHQCVKSIEEEQERNAAFIAAVHPGSILALVADVRRLREVEAERDVMRKELLAARAWQTAMVDVTGLAKVEGDNLRAEVARLAKHVTAQQVDINSLQTEAVQREAVRNALLSQVMDLRARAASPALAVALRELKERRNNWAASLAQLQAKGGDEGGDFVTASYERTIAEVDEAIAAVKMLKEGV